ncbi:MAG: hypothetical protein HYU27_04410 [Acidobacteria bacterium]|nr:hypothetical protein [Acidobacteriota bacterium]
MNKKFLVLTAALAFFIATTALTPEIIAGQGAPPAGGQGAPAAQGGGGRGGGGQRAAVPGGPVTRLSDGKPNMTGAWSIRGGLANITTGMVDPPDKVIPYTPVYKQLRAESPQRMYEEPELHCYQSGVPSHMWRQGYAGAQLVIQQTPDHIVFMTEFQGSYRIVPLNNRPHIPENIKLFMGDGVGHWEGDTLVIETTNNNAITWLDNDGDRHSDALTVVERFTLNDANNGVFEATFTDPKAYTRPWKIQAPMARNTNPNAEILEFACVEGNQDHTAYTEDVGGKAKQAPIAAPAEFLAPPRGGGRGGGRGGAPGAPPPGGGAPQNPPPPQ